MLQRVQQRLQNIVHIPPTSVRRKDCYLDNQRAFERHDTSSGKDRADRLTECSTLTTDECPRSEMTPVVIYAWRMWKLNDGDSHRFHGGVLLVLEPPVEGGGDAVDSRFE